MVPQILLTEAKKKASIYVFVGYWVQVEYHELE